MRYFGNLEAMFTCARVHRVHRGGALLCQSTLNGHPVAGEGRLLGVLRRSHRLPRLLLDLSHRLLPLPARRPLLQQVIPSLFF